MNKRIICLLCAVIMIVLFFTACSDDAADRTPTDNAVPVDDPQPTTDRPTTFAPTTHDTQSVAYWRTPGFDGVEMVSGDYWSDLFLWEDGTGYFRFSQATPAGHFYGVHDEIDCDWSIDPDGSLTLLRSGTKTVLYTGSIVGDVLTIRYNGYTEEIIRMEQAEMPPCGSHWTILDLYGTWKMTSYYDIASGHNTVWYYTGDVENGFFASEITLDRIGGAHFWMTDPLISRFLSDRDMVIGSYDGGNWIPYISGPIWDGCVNEAWHIELTDNDNPNVHYSITFAEDRLLMKKEDETDLNNFPASFIAEFEYVGYTPDFADASIGEIVDKRCADVAYSIILHDYRSAIQNGRDANGKTDYAVNLLEGDANIEDEMMLLDLSSSLQEPLFYLDDCVFGYAVRDINEDGIPELFILYEDDYSDDYFITALYTIRDGRVVLVGAYWSRHRCTLAEDGTVYINSSSGADDSSCVSYSLRRRTGELRLIERYSNMYDPDISAAEAGLVFYPLAGTPANTQTGAMANSTSNTGAPHSGTVVYLFNRIIEYNGKVYSIYASPEISNFTGISGSKAFTPLPEVINGNMTSEGLYIYTFTIYQNKIYYLAAEAGSDITPGAIYRCNLDGSKNEYLANATNDSTCMIKDGWLYFDGDIYLSGYEVYAINLNDDSTGNNNEARLVRNTDFPEYIEPGIYRYNDYIYYFSGNTLCKKNIYTESISSIMTPATGTMNTSGDVVVIAVTNGTVYYVTLGEYSATGNIYLFGVSINGGSEELLASWFMS